MDSAPAGVLHPPTDPPFSETGHWNSICIACHATHGKPEFDTPFGSQPLDTQVVDTTVAEFGIACEACHGPGERHVRANRNPLRRYGLHLTGSARSDHRPARAPEPAAVVAGVRPVPRHLGVLRSRRASGRRTREGCPYRPGDELTKTRFVAQPTVNADSPTMKALLADDPGFIRDSFWSDGMVRVSGREYNGLIDSPCFKDAPAGHPERTLLLLVPHDAQAGRRSAPLERVGRRSARGGHGRQRRVPAVPRAYRDEPARAHQASRRFGRQLLLQLPHAVHDLRAAEDDSQPPDQQPDGGESAERRPNACNRVISTRRWRGRRTSSTGTGAADTTRSGRADDRGVAALAFRGDAGQRALVAWSMGWSRRSRPRVRAGCRLLSAP